MNPAAAVRGPRHVVKTGKTPVLEGEEWRKLLASIPTTTLRDLRDRALIATLTYSFARITAALKMKVEDLRPRGAGWTVRLHEKGGKQHAMPCHHALAEALRAYIDAAGIAEDRKGWLFRTAAGHNGSSSSKKPMSQPDAWRMIRRRAAAAGIAAEIGCHMFRATGITHRRTPHLGFGDDPPSASPHDRAGRRDIARQHALGALQARFPAAGARAVPPVPAALPVEACRRPSDGPGGVLRPP